MWLSAKLNLCVQTFFYALFFGLSEYSRTLPGYLVWETLHQLAKISQQLYRLRTTSEQL